MALPKLVMLGRKLDFFRNFLAIQDTTLHGLLVSDPVCHSQFKKVSVIYWSTVSKGGYRQWSTLKEENSRDFCKKRENREIFFPWGIERDCKNPSKFRSNIEIFQANFSSLTSDRISYNTNYWPIGQFFHKTKMFLSKFRLLWTY